jgi:DNA-binding CsgD family transcriptional regulator
MADPFHSRAPVTVAQLVDFLNGIPITGDSDLWARVMIDGLKRLFDDVDYASVNFNIYCDPLRPEMFTEHVMDTSMHSGGPATGDGSNVTVTPLKGEKASDLFVRDALAYYASRSVQPPSCFHYYMTEWAYLGSILLWREQGRSAVSRRTIELMEALEPFIKYLFSAALALRHSARPFDTAFRDGLLVLESDGRLTVQERRVVTLKLFGHSYKQIAARLDLSLDTVRSHVKSIHRKTNTRSHTELFAKYFTPRGDSTDVENYL